MRFIKGLLYGAALMYWFDPDMGRTRRTRMLDQVVGTRNRLRRRAQGRWRDLRNRAEGTLAEIRGAGRSRQQQPSQRSAG